MDIPPGMTVCFLNSSHFVRVNISDANMTCNNSVDDEVEVFLKFERYVRIIVPLIFGLISLLGLVGNLLVIIVVTINQQMRSTTNILIFSLAVADLCFIIFCVPFTAAGYAFPTWPFGNVWCKIMQYMTYVCAYFSVYTLVVMSLDRYLAVVHPISSMGYRTQSNTIIIVLVVWAIILAGHIPLLFQYEVMEYIYVGEDRSACMNKVNIDNKLNSQMFYGSFFAFGYILPLLLICAMYGFMLKRLLYGVVPGGSQRAESIRSKKRVTKMVIIVVVIFALCWLPIQVVFMFQNFGNYPDKFFFIAAQMAANCLAYMNSCVNPILYAFLSENFRRSFRKLLCCGTVQYTKFEYERTNIKNTDAREKMYTQSCSNTQSTSLQTLESKPEKNGNEAVNHCPHTEV